MKNIKAFKTGGIILIIIGIYLIANLIFKLFAGQSNYISTSDMSGIVWLALGLILFWRYKKLSKTLGE